MSFDIVFMSSFLKSFINALCMSSRVLMILRLIDLSLIHIYWQWSYLIAWQRKLRIRGNLKSLHTIINTASSFYIAKAQCKKNNFCQLKVLQHAVRVYKNTWFYVNIVYGIDYTLWFTFRHSIFVHIAFSHIKNWSLIGSSPWDVIANVRINIDNKVVVYRLSLIHI